MRPKRAFPTPKFMPRSGLRLPEFFFSDFEDETQIFKALFPDGSAQASSADQRLTELVIAARKSFSVRQKSPDMHYSHLATTVEWCAPLTTDKVRELVLCLVYYQQQWHAQPIPGQNPTVLAREIEKLSNLYNEETNTTGENEVEKNATAADLHNRIHNRKELRALRKKEQSRMRKQEEKKEKLEAARAKEKVGGIDSHDWTRPDDEGTTPADELLEQFIDDGESAGALITSDPVLVRLREEQRLEMVKQRWARLKRKREDSPPPTTSEVAIRTEHAADADPVLFDEAKNTLGPGDKDWLAPEERDPAWHRDNYPFRPLKMAKVEATSAETAPESGEEEDFREMDAAIQREFEEALSEEGSAEEEAEAESVESEEE